MGTGKYQITELKKCTSDYRDILGDERKDELHDRILHIIVDEKKYLKYSEIVPLASLDDVVFGCWDVYPQNAYQSAVYAEVLKREDVDAVRDELEQIIPMKAAFDRN